MPRTIKPGISKPRISKPRKGSPGLVLIGIFKLLKAIILVLVGFGALHYLRVDLRESVNHWIQVFRVDPENRYIHRLLERIFSVTPKQLRELSVGTFIYAAILGTEGVGLLTRKHWAEYFTIISTGIFVPLELYELVHRFTFIKLGVLALNVVIVWYLVARLRKEKVR